jgi:hypothetical protein
VKLQRIRYVYLAEFLITGYFLENVSRFLEIMILKYTGTTWFHAVIPVLLQVRPITALSVMN